MLNYFNVRISKMKKNYFIIFILVVLPIIVYRKSFFTFFTQDDFVLITQFSHHGVFVDLWHVFASPEVTHWRPIHNLYFFLMGNIFSKNYFAYHLLTFLFHISSAFIIYKIALKFISNKIGSLSAGLIYVIHPAFFVSYFWISGGATVIGFFLFILSFYLYLSGKIKFSIIVYFLSLLASEAMVAGTLVFIFYRFIFKSKDKADNLWLKNLIVIISFIIVRFVYLRPKAVGDTYSFEINYKIFTTLKYYVLQVIGYVDIQHGFLLAFGIFAWLVFLIVLLFKNRNYSKLIFFLSVLFSGLFPFVFIPNHLSGHYMSISIFGFSMLTALALQSLKPKAVVYFMAIFLFLSYVSVNKTYENNWVISRSRISKQYIEAIGKSNLPDGSTIVFNDNVISSSYDAYISLGTGKAIDFWFGQKKYKTCFTEFEICETKP